MKKMLLMSLVALMGVPAFGSDQNLQQNIEPNEQIIVDEESAAQLEQELTLPEEFGMEEDEVGTEQRRRWRCLARARFGFGRTFIAQGRSYRRAAFRALNTCRRYSPPFVARSCRVVRCSYFGFRP